MIEQAGLDFDTLAPESLDMPLGFKTGAGVIFGASGGVTEAVLRYAAEKIGKTRLENVNFTEVRGNQQLKEADITIGDVNIKLAVVHGLRNARTIAELAKKGECPYDIVEVMACPGGCIGGAGQPVCNDVNIRQKRAASLYDIDKTLQLHKSQDNHMIAALYENEIGEINGHRAHELLHTAYSSKQRLTPMSMPLTGTASGDAVRVKVCVGTNCFLKGFPADAQKTRTLC